MNWNKVSQIAPFIVLVIVVILELIFILSQDVPRGQMDMKFSLICLEAGFFIIPFYPIWLMISLFTAG